jgi:hypothetical protein
VADGQTRRGCTQGRATLGTWRGGGAPTNVRFLSKSGRQESNLRSCVPKTHGFTVALHPVAGRTIELPPEGASQFASSRSLLPFAGMGVRLSAERSQNGRI